jgi:hypothetical protein
MSSAQRSTNTLRHHAAPVCARILEKAPKQPLV